MGEHGTDLDLGIGFAWCADYADPLEFTEPLVGGVASYAVVTPRYRRQLARAERLQDRARLRAFGKLDVQLMNDLAPVAVTRTYNKRFLFSDRVDPRSLVYQGSYSDWSIPALALK